MVIIKNAIKNNIPFLVLLTDFFWIKIMQTKTILGTINEIPPNPKIKLELTRSNPSEVIMVAIV